MKYFDAKSNNSRIRCAFITGTFPALSEAFLINVATGLLDKGIDLRIFATAANEQAKGHQLYQKYDLEATTTYLAELTPLSIFSDLINQFGILGGKRFAQIHSDIFKKRQHYKIGRLRLKPILEYRPDVLYCNFVGTAASYSFLREMGLVKKLIIGVYGGDVTIRELTYPYANIFRSSDAIIAISNHIKSQLLSLGCDEEKIHLIPLPVEPSEFPLKKYAVPGSTLHILSAGRLVEKKGFVYGIRAVKKLVDMDCQITYTVVGDGPLRSALFREIEKNNLQNVVQLVGPKNHEQLLEIYHSSDVLLVPSVTAENGDMEGQVVVIQEAGLAGLPVIASKHNGIPDGVVNGVTGFLVPERDCTEIAERLKQLTEQKQLLQQMGLAHRQFVLEKYSKDIISEKITNLLR